MLTESRSTLGPKLESEESRRRGPLHFVSGRGFASSRSRCTLRSLAHTPLPVGLAIRCRLTVSPMSARRATWSSERAHHSRGTCTAHSIKEPRLNDGAGMYVTPPAMQHDLYRARRTRCRRTRSNPCTSQVPSSQRTHPRRCRHRRRRIERHSLCTRVRAAKSGRDQDK